MKKLLTKQTNVLIIDFGKNKYSIMIFGHNRLSVSEFQKKREKYE